MEILELYAELLLARAGLLDVRDKNVKEGLVSKDAGGGEGGEGGTGLEEAAAAIIYAAPRLPRDVRELGIVRSLLIDRFGKDFAMKAQENEGNMVPDRVWKKLEVKPPSQALVEAYLTEIAKTYGVDWPRHNVALDEAQAEVDDEDDDDGEGGNREQPILADGAGPSTPAKTHAKDLKLGPLPPSGQPSVEGSKSPVSVAPPGGRSDNLRPGVKLPGGGQVKPRAASGSVGKAGGELGAPPTVDDLASRFKALGKK